jgi:hypothetical protein
MNARGAVRLRPRLLNTRYVLFLLNRYQLLNIISPLLSTFPMFQPSRDDKHVDSLEEILASKLGV